MSGFDEILYFLIKHIFQDLSRAKTTCRLILGQNSASAIKEIVEDPRIRERNFGVYENANYSEFEDKVKECGFERWIDYTPNNGESHEDIHNRARTFITVSNIYLVCIGTFVLVILII